MRNQTTREAIGKDAGKNKNYVNKFGGIIKTVLLRFILLNSHFLLLNLLK